MATEIDLGAVCPKPRTGPPTDEKYSGRVCALIWVAGIVVTWGAALWLIAWALAR